MDTSYPPEARHTDLSAKEVLRPDEVEAVFGFPVGTLKQWRHLGIGPEYVKPAEGRSGYVYYRRSAINVWLNEHTVETETATAAEAT